MFSIQMQKAAARSYGGRNILVPPHFVNFFIFNILPLCFFKFFLIRVFIFHPNYFVKVTFVEVVKLN